MSEVKVWIVRHGERVDEAPGNAWVKSGAGNPWWFDPPLTEDGHKHAELVATKFRDGEQPLFHFHAGYWGVTSYTVYKQPDESRLRTCLPLKEAPSQTYFKATVTYDAESTRFLLLSHALSPRYSPFLQLK